MALSRSLEGCRSCYPEPASLLFLPGGKNLLYELIGNPRRVSPNDTVQVACIGMGIMGYNDTEAAVRVPGVRLVAACDLYTGRLQRAKEVYGNDLYTTRRFS